MSIDTFTDLGVPAELTKILAAQGITKPSPIQAASLPDSLDGADILGRGRTGSGKTLAFLLPLVVGLDENNYEARPKKPRALVLAPTRELATQINTALAPLAKEYDLTHVTVFGGVGQKPQVDALRKGTDILIACPGRLEDLMNQGHADLSDVEITILDEADHMADLGFLPGVTRILKATPDDGQRMLFSATLDSGIKKLVDKFLHNPITHEADSAQSPVTTMTHHVLHVTDEHHLDVLVNLLARTDKAVVFTRTKHRAKRMAKKLNAAGVPSVELHGNLAQNARTRNMAAFSSGDARVLVATDIAARGIHIDHVDLVIHADPPVEHKAYLHRSGRTARAGAAGTVITMMTDEQTRDVRDLLRKAGIKAPTTRVTPEHTLIAELVPGEPNLPGAWTSPVPTPKQRPAGQGTGRRGRSRGRGRDSAGPSATRNNENVPRHGTEQPRPARSNTSTNAGSHTPNGTPTAGRSRSRKRPAKRRGTQHSSKPNN
ncbi:ATP-dependent RNA helicase rhlE [Dermatophilus congolensis]|uniref:ATP-dependent RNA helicase rhlE n=1 Tax=Dermatophilus congolensis TaxID=1863 RepID=A0A239VC58_9MICO|nr:DEAD/DEAH box helicase [Dermatophilus congolensis]SNV19755.1 ATP-dependent RNA helicase rhlE [Dermatophilus congolensis]